MRAQFKINNIEHMQLILYPVWYMPFHIVYLFIILPFSNVIKLNIICRYSEI